MTRLTQSALAALIDHTLLKPDASSAEINRLCHEAVAHGFATVCVSPYRVLQAKELTRDSKVKVCTVVGFPGGANRSEIKALEAVRASADGADELDMVMNIGAAKEGDWITVEADIRAVVKAAQGRVLKVILETSFLSADEITRACLAAVTAGAAFVKTSTGFTAHGASAENVRLMRAAVGDRLGVKASGGIRDLDTLLKMVEAGATRIGTSSGVAIMNQQTGKDAY